MTEQQRGLRIAELEREIQKYPKGKVCYKSIKGKVQPYLQWSEGGKTRTKYVKVAEREEIFRQLEQRDRLQQELNELKHTLATEISATQIDAIDKVVFRTNVVTGIALDNMIQGVRNFQKRDCYTKLNRFIRSETYGKVCILYGLRRTGKTTLLFQTLADLSAEERTNAAYIKARVTDTMSDVNADLKKLRSMGCQYVFLDEITLLEDFIDSASILSDIYAMQGMKIVLSGTDSLGFWMAEGNELYDRAYMIHTTYIPFREYSRLLGIDDIDEYIRYGGTLMPGETAFDDPDALDETAAFRDDESTRRYIDTAICRNIQHSLACFKDGLHFRHLRQLYEADELTGAINRIIESMNHQFLLRILISKFKSHDLGSANQILQKGSRHDQPTDILDRIDKDAVTKKLMDMLEIRNREDQTIGITQTHVAEIKEYLKALDLVVDCPTETTIQGAAQDEYVLFTQPGMRYCQAQALVHVLMRDPLFQIFDEWEKTLATEKILEDVRGKMMEDIVLLDTVRTLPKGKRAFKLLMGRKECDMAIYDSLHHTIEEYECKHSKERVAEQAQAMLDEELLGEVEAKYGRITRRCVIYRGESGIADNGVQYQNVEAYLKHQ